MNTLLVSTQRLTAAAALALLAAMATPALADGHDDGYRGRGYDAPHYQNYDRGNYDDRGRGHDYHEDRGRDYGHYGDYDRDHGYRGDDRHAYYVTPYYQPPRVIYAPPPPVAYYPSAPYRNGIEVRLLQLF